MRANKIASDSSQSRATEIIERSSQDTSRIITRPQSQKWSPLRNVVNSHGIRHSSDCCPNLWHNLNKIYNDISDAQNHKVINAYDTLCN